MSDESQTSPPVVLQVLPALHTGGVERGTLEVTQAIVAAGGVALVASAGGRLVSRVEGAGGRHFTMALGRKDPVSIWANSLRLRALIRRERVDIVHARSRAPAWAAWRACRGGTTHFMTTWHGSYGEDLPGKRAYNAVMARGERIIAPSQHTAAELMRRHEVPEHRVRVIYRGVDPAMFDPLAVRGDRLVRLAAQWRLLDGQRVVLLAARLTRWKGQALAITALAAMQQTDVCLILAGDDQGRTGYVAELMKLAVRLGVGDRVRMVGDCNDMPAALMLADVALNASLAPEAFGRTVIEAQAMERIVLAAGHGGAAETVQDGMTGLLFPPGDAAALAAALDRALWMQPGARQDIAAAARRSVCDHFTTAAMQRATLDVYDELLNGLAADPLPQDAIAADV